MSLDSDVPVAMPETAPLLPSLLETHDEGLTATTVTDILPPPATEGSAESPELNREDFVSCLFQLAAALCFATANVTSRFVQTRVLLSTTSVLLAVGLGETCGALLYLLFFTSLRVEFGRIASRELLLLLAGGVSGSTAMLGVFSGFHSLPVGDARAVFLVTPVMFLFVAAIVLSEPLKKTSFLAAIVAFTGVMLVSRPDFFVKDADAFNPSSHDRIVGTLHMLCGALAFCFVYMVMRKLIMSVHFMIAVLSLGVTTVILSLAMGGGFQALSFLLREPSTILGGSIVALFMFLGLLYLSYGLMSSNTNISLMLYNVELILTYFFASFILDEIPTVVSLIGSSLIVISTLIVALV